MADKDQNSDLLKKLSEKKAEYQEFESDERLTWCSGCGNFGIQHALERALALEGFSPKDVVQAFDIGCHGNGSDKINGYTIHGLHGRVLSLASGAALANQNIKVIAHAGDGGTLSEGINHLIHTVRNDYPVLFILYNNSNYGLTTGQASATTRKNVPMNASPDGVVAKPMNPCELVLTLNPTFVARTFSGDIKHMTKVLQEGLKHKGFAFIEVFQVCPTYNKATPKDWYWDRLNDVDADSNYDRTNLKVAKDACTDLDNKINVGVLYQKSDEPPFLDKLKQRKGKKTTLTQEVQHYKIDNLIKNLK